MNLRYSHRPRSIRTGFTLVEMLVVIGIIVILASILVPVAIRALGSADKTRVQFLLQTITSGLEAYRADFNDYPRTSRNDTTLPGDDNINADNLRGARILAKALLGPQPQGNLTPATVSTNFNNDGADGNGFRVADRTGTVNTSSKVYGPYIAADRFRIRLTDGTGAVSDFGAAAIDDTAVIADPFGNPILYFPASRGSPNLTSDLGTTTDGYGGFVSNSTASPAVAGGLFDLADGWRYLNTDLNIARQVFEIMLGDSDANGRINGGETARSTGPFVLWSAGPDITFGPLTGTAVDRNLPNKIDDVTNFQQ